MLKSLLTTTGGVAVLSAAAACFDPSLVPAAIRSKPAPPPNRQVQEEFIQTLARLLSGCTDVLAIHKNPTTASVDVVLWLHDAENPGVIDAEELALLSHDRLARTLTIYSINQVDADESADDQATAGVSALRQASSADSHKANTRDFSWPHVRTLASRRSIHNQPQFTIISRGTIADPKFCARWRGDRRVRAQVIGEQISDMHLEREEPLVGELSRLRLSLRWVDDSADGADADRTGDLFQAVIERAPRQAGAQE